MARLADARLVRELRRWDLVALVINAVIGAGIFGLPSRVFALAGSYSIVAYVIAAATMLLIVLCFAEVGSRFSHTGGPYLYARTAFGSLAGFQVGWLLWLGRITSIAALSNLFVGYVGFFWPAAVNEPWRSVVIVALLAPLAAANVRGVRVTTTVTNTLTTAKLVPLCLFGFVGLFFVDPARYSFSPIAYGSFAEAALLLVFTFMGFEAASIPTGETRNPGKHLPFALLAGMGFVACLYIGVQIVAIGTLPDLAQSPRPLAEASLRFLGTAGALLMSVGALVSITGTQNASLFATPRLLFAMSEKGQLPRVLGSTHDRFNTPAAAIVLTALASIGLALLSTFISALTISTVVRLMAYTVTCASLPLLRRREGAAPFSVPGGNVVAVAAVVLSLWLLSSSAATEMRTSLLAVVVGLAIQAAMTRR
jgi:amino acid transporter